LHGKSVRPAAVEAISPSRADPSPVDDTSAPHDTDLARQGGAPGNDEIEILVVGTPVLMDNMIAVMRWLQERGFS
jgi:hypothetical protein